MVHNKELCGHGKAMLGIILPRELLRAIGKGSRAARPYKILNERDLYHTLANEVRAMLFECCNKCHLIFVKVKADCLNLPQLKSLSYLSI